MAKMAPRGKQPHLKVAETSSRLRVSSGYIPTRVVRPERGGEGAGISY